MRIGLFGGSFNPIHKEHVKIMRQVLDKKLVDEIWIIPCKSHPFNKSFENEQHRVKMIRLAIKDNTKIKINKVELNSRGKSYTLRTVNKLKKKYKHEFFLIIGSDILYEIKEWHGHEVLFERIAFIIVKRKGYPTMRIKGMKIHAVLSEDSSSISSSCIRENILHGRSVKKMVCKDVESYILKNNLYKK